MKSFLILTECDRRGKLYVALDHLASFNRLANNKATEIVVSGEVFFHVTETPEEILLKVEALTGRRAISLGGSE